MKEIKKIISILIHPTTLLFIAICFIVLAMITDLLYREVREEQFAKYAFLLFSASVIESLIISFLQKYPKIKKTGIQIYRKKFTIVIKMIKQLYE